MCTYIYEYTHKCIYAFKTPPPAFPRESALFFLAARWKHSHTNTHNRTQGHTYIDTCVCQCAMRECAFVCLRVFHTMGSLLLYAILCITAFLRWHTLVSDMHSGVFARVYLLRHDLLELQSLLLECQRANPCALAHNFCALLLPPHPHQDTRSSHTHHQNGANDPPAHWNGIHSLCRELQRGVFGAAVGYLLSYPHLGRRR